MTLRQRTGLKLVWDLGSWLWIDSYGFRVGPVFGSIEAAYDWLEGRGG